MGDADLLRMVDAVVGRMGDDCAFVLPRMGDAGSEHMDDVSETCSMGLRMDDELSIDVEDECMRRRVDIVDVWGACIRVCCKDDSD
jgi:hypothetical protein